MTRARDAGVILLNVLVLLGIAASVVYVMLNLADLSIARSQRFSEASQALALVRAGEQSAVVALRRDMATAPKIDHPGEPWARVAQSGIGIEGGTFALEIEDAQALFNLNALVEGGVSALETLRAIVAELELDPRLADRIADSMARGGKLAQVNDLVPRAGLAPADVAQLRRLVTALPGGGDVNINVAPAELLAALLRNPVQARLLVAMRDRAGFLTPDQVENAGVLLPPGVGYTSNFYRTRIAVRIGDTLQAVESLLQRLPSQGRPEVAVVSRQIGTAAVLPPPPLVPSPVTEG